MRLQRACFDPTVFPSQTILSPVAKISFAERSTGPAARLMPAIEAVTGAGTVLPADLDGSATTAEVTDAVCSRLVGG